MRSPWRNGSTVTDSSIPRAASPTSPSSRRTPRAANIVAYAEIVRERAVLRELIRTSTEIADAAFRPEGRAALDLLDDAERRIFEIAERGGAAQRESVAIRDVLVSVMERIDELSRRDSPITGVPTGFEDLDRKTAGLQYGDLVIVAGRPSMGKTSFTMNIVEMAAIRAELPVIVFSMEMPAEQLTMRMLSSLGRIDQQKVRTGKLDDDDWPRLTSQLALLNDTKIFIVDEPALTPTELRARCRRLKREHGLGLVVIDYLQLMHVPGTRENRATEISEISRSLKALAKELMVPVVACSQLNRGLEQRQDKRPVMSDLRESGAIEQDADLILFIYRDEVYNEESKDKGKAEIIIGKQRNGPIGRVELAFLNKYTRFENYTPIEYSGELRRLSGTPAGRCGRTHREDAIRFARSVEAPAQRRHHLLRVEVDEPPLVRPRSVEHEVPEAERDVGRDAFDVLFRHGRDDPAASRPLGRQRIGEALHLRRILHPHLLLRGECERGPVPGVLHRTLPVGVERDLHLDHELDVSIPAPGLGHPLAYRGQEGFGVEIRLLAAGADEAVRDPPSEPRRDRPGSGDVERNRRVGAVVDGRVLGAVVLALIGDPLLGPEPAHQLDGFLEPAEPLAERRPLAADGRHLVQRLPGADPQHHPARIHRAEGAHRLRDDGGVVAERGGDDAGADHRPGGSFPQRAEPGEGVGGRGRRYAATAGSDRSP